jgi:hypothetical protein
MRARRNPLSVLFTPAALAGVLAATLILGAAVALAGVRAGKYSGSTSEQGTVTLTVSAGGKKITHFDATLGYNGKCGQGGGPGLTAAPAAIAIGAGGRFSEDVALNLGTLVHDRGRVLGRVSGAKVTGTIEQFLDGKVNKCYVETFTAHRG